MNVKAAKSTSHAVASVHAASRALAALRGGKPVALSDAKILEAAGCYLRRNSTEATR